MLVTRCQMEDDASFEECVWDFQLLSRASYFPGLQMWEFCSSVKKKKKTRVKLMATSKPSWFLGLELGLGLGWPKINAGMVHCCSRWYYFLDFMHTDIRIKSKSNSPCDIYWQWSLMRNKWGQMIPGEERKYKRKKKHWRQCWKMKISLRTFVFQ